MTADDQIRTVPSQEPCQHPLFAVRPAFVLVAPMHEGDNAIDRTAVDGRQIAGDDRRIDSVDRRARRHWQTVGAIGIVEQREADAVRREPQRMVGTVPQRVDERSRVAQTRIVERGERRADTPRAAVATMVVGRDGYVDTRPAQGSSQRRRGTETGITRMGSGGGEGSFEIDHDQIGSIEAGLHEAELSEEIVRSVRPPCRGQLRQMGHHVAREEQARTENAFVGRNRRRNDTLHPHAAQIPCADDDRSDHRQQYGTGTQPLHRPPRRFFFSRFGNQPFATRSRCSNSSPIPHNDDAPHTASRIERIRFSTHSDAASAATPDTAKAHQHRTPK